MANVTFDNLGTVIGGGVRTELRLWHHIPEHSLNIENPVGLLSYGLNPNAALWGRELSNARTSFTRLGALNFWPNSGSWELRSNGSSALSIMSFFEDEELTEVDRQGRWVVDINDASVIELLLQLRDEIHSPGFASSALVESIGEFLRIKLNRLTFDRYELECVAGLNAAEFRLVRDYIETRRGETPTVSGLANLCKISRRSLLRRFKATTGMTAANYISLVQIEKAKRLLISSNMHLKEISYELGFNGPSNFSSAFKRHLGVTPSAFRKTARSR